MPAGPSTAVVGDDRMAYRFDPIDRIVNDRRIGRLRRAIANGSGESRASFARVHRVHAIDSVERGASDGEGELSDGSANQSSESSRIGDAAFGPTGTPAFELLAIHRLVRTGLARAAPQQLGCKPATCLPVLDEVAQ